MVGRSDTRHWDRLFSWTSSQSFWESGTTPEFPRYLSRSVSLVMPNPNGCGTGWKWGKICRAGLKCACSGHIGSISVKWVVYTEKLTLNQNQSATRSDLPLNFHPAAIRASTNVTPFGAVSVWRHVQAKQWVLEHNAVGTDIYFLTSGAVWVLISPSPVRDVILGDIEAGWLFWRDGSDRRYAALG